MKVREGLVLQRQRHLKWRRLDVVENVLMWLCGIALIGFSTSVLCDIVTRIAGRPWLWLQEVTMTFFIYGIFLGAAVATRRNDHLCLSAAPEALRGTSPRIVEILIRLLILSLPLFLVSFPSAHLIQGLP